MTRQELERRSITKVGMRHDRIIGGSGKVSWWGFLLILGTLITSSHWPISDPYDLSHSPQTSAGLCLELLALGLGQFSHHHLSFIFYCLCQWFSHNPPRIHLHRIPELQLFMNFILLADSFVLTPTSFPTVYCSVSPLPLNYFPLFLANTYKHGLCTCT